MNEKEVMDSASDAVIREIEGELPITIETDGSSWVLSGPPANAWSRFASPIAEQALFTVLENQHMPHATPIESELALARKTIETLIAAFRTAYDGEAFKRRVPVRVQNVMDQALSEGHQFLRRAVVRDESIVHLANVHALKQELHVQKETDVAEIRSMGRQLSAFSVRYGKAYDAVYSAWSKSTRGTIQASIAAAVTRDPDGLEEPIRLLIAERDAALATVYALQKALDLTARPMPDIANSARP